MQNTSKNVFNDTNFRHDDVKEARVLKFHNVPGVYTGPKKYKTDHYFNVKNHQDLFDIGKHYLKLLNNGKKSFSFYSEDTKFCQHTLLGLSSFFSYHEDIKSIILVDKFETSELKSLLHNPVKEKKTYNDEYAYEVLNFPMLEIIEYSSLKSMAAMMGPEHFGQFIAKLIMDSDLVLIEMPKIESINSEKEFFFPLIRSMGPLSLMVETGKTKNKGIKDFVKFSSKYDIDIEGVLLVPTSPSFR